MSEQQFRKEVMAELEQQEDFDDDEIVCVYCGSPKGSNFSCCGETYIVTVKRVVIFLALNRLNVWALLANERQQTDFLFYKWMKGC